MNNQFKHLFTPVKLGPMTVKNRLYISGHTVFPEHDPSGYGRWSALGERAAYYYAERARGGFGLLVAGSTMVHPQAGAFRPGAYHRQARARFKRIAEMVHEHGTKVVVQINQHGRLKGGSGSDDWWPMWTPSALLPVPAYGLPHKPSGEMSKEMEPEEIKTLVAAYAQSAENVQAAGIDGVEVHMGHTHLFSEWLLPAFNHRTDQYGGSLENRMRIIIETLEAIRKAVGRDFAVGVRMNLEWPFPAGQPLGDTLEIAQMLDASGLLDYISCTIFPAELSMPGNRLPPGFQIPKAAAVKEVVKLPVLALGRIIDPLEAEKILAAGLVDMVGMTKAGIADPELPRKAMEGRLDDIRPCIGGQQGCFARIILEKPLSCTQNPTVGLEKDWGAGTIKPAATKKKVVIVGGGPAGMEAALISAQRGHQVTLYERGERLGGQVNFIGKVPHRDEFLGVVRWREGQVRKLPIEVRLKTEVTPAMLLESDADAVVLATGSRPRVNGWYPELAHLPGIPGGDLPHVFNYLDVLQDKIAGRKHVVVVDGLGYYQSSDALEYLILRGCTVEAVASGQMFAQDMLGVDRTLWLKGLRGKAVTFHDAAMVHRILDRSVQVEHLVTGKRYNIEDVDAVVLSLGNDVNDDLYKALKGKVKALHRIGDCLTPRRIEQAIHEGHKLGREL